MCEKCTELDFNIAKYRRMAVVVTDHLARDAMTALIEQMTKDKTALHHRSTNAAAPEVGGR
jgi:hypothetical protein